MSQSSPASAGRPATSRRVRHQARDVLLVMAFSAGASAGVTALLLLLVDTGR